jgi:hypothetical protein
MKTAVKVNAEIIVWQGAASRKPRAWRPCGCGCDNRGREVPMVGYLTASNKKGEGITIEAPDEATYQAFVAVFGGDK